MIFVAVTVLRLGLRSLVFREAEIRAKPRAPLRQRCLTFNAL